MANNRNQQNRGDQNRGGGGGGGDNKITIIAGVSGKRDDCKIGVVLRKGRLGLPDENIMFRCGTPDRPQGPWMMDQSNPANRYMLTTNPEGEAESPAFDLSGAIYKDYTQILVVYTKIADPGRGVYEQAVQLPPAETTDGPKVVKNKRLQFKAPESPLKSDDNRFALPAIRTLNRDGKPEAADLIFTATVPVTLFDKSTGTLLRSGSKAARNTKYFAFQSSANGLAVLECQFAGFECKLNLLHVESGEEASVDMEFNY